jgi:hypothetical protein
MVQYNVIPYNIRVEYTRVQNKLFPYNVRVEYTMVQCKLFPMTFEWCSMPENDAQCVIPVKCRISFKTMLCPNFLMVWYADIVIFSGFVVMCMYIR